MVLPSSTNETVGQLPAIPLIVPVIETLAAVEVVVVVVVVPVSSATFSASTLPSACVEPEIVKRAPSFTSAQVPGSNRVEADVLMTFASSLNDTAGHVPLVALAVPVIVIATGVNAGVRLGAGASFSAITLPSVCTGPDTVKRAPSFTSAHVAPENTVAADVLNVLPSSLNVTTGQLPLIKLTVPVSVTAVGVGVTVVVVAAAGPTFSASTLPSACVEPAMVSRVPFFTSAHAMPSNFVDAVVLKTLPSSLNEIAGHVPANKLTVPIIPADALAVPPDEFAVLEDASASAAGAVPASCEEQATPKAAARMSAERVNTGSLPNAGSDGTSVRGSTQRNKKQLRANVVSLSSRHIPYAHAGADRCTRATRLSRPPLPQHEAADVRHLLVGQCAAAPAGRHVAAQKTGERRPTREL